MIINIASTRKEAEEKGVNVRCIDVPTPEDKEHKVWLYDTHVGLCIEDYERNGYDDSDFFMIVWNPETMEPENICFATTRGWTYPCYASKPDATPEVMEQYNVWLENRRAILAEESRIAELKRPLVGKEVTIVGGRKHKNKSGRIFWLGANRYNGEKTVGVECANSDRFFVPASYVEVMLEQEVIA